MCVLYLLKVMSKKILSIYVSGIIRIEVRTLTLIYNKYKLIMTKVDKYLFAYIV